MHIFIANNPVRPPQSPLFEVILGIIVLIGFHMLSRPTTGGAAPAAVPVPAPELAKV